MTEWEMNRRQSSIQIERGELLGVFLVLSHSSQRERESRSCCTCDCTARVEITQTVHTRSRIRMIAKPPIHTRAPRSDRQFTLSFLPSLLACIHSVLTIQPSDTRPRDQVHIRYQPDRACTTSSFHPPSHEPPLPKKKKKKKRGAEVAHIQVFF